MALISCPECGNKVSDKSKTCVHCGSPLQAPESRLIVYGLNERFLIGGTMRLYIDSSFVGEVKKFDRFETAITKDCTLSVECGVNISKPSCEIKAGEVTKMQILYRRNSTGGFYLQKWIPSLTVQSDKKRITQKRTSLNIIFNGSCALQLPLFYQQILG